MNLFIHLAILDILEDDEDLEKQFESSVSDVRTNQSRRTLLLFRLEHSKLISGTIVSVTMHRS